MSEHLTRTLAAMTDVDVDVLLLGRSPNVRYVSGANQLALAGTRPFAPACVVVRGTGAVHLMTTTDEGERTTTQPGANARVPASHNRVVPATARALASRPSSTTSTS